MSLALGLHAGCLLHAACCLSCVFLGSPACSWALLYSPVLSKACAQQGCLGEAIGTEKAFAGGYEYNYRFADDINMYVCDHKTTTKLSPPLVIRFLVLHVK